MAVSKLFTPKLDKEAIGFDMTQVKEPHDVFLNIPVQPEVINHDNPTDKMIVGPLKLYGKGQTITPKWKNRANIQHQYRAKIK